MNFRGIAVFVLIFATLSAYSNDNRTTITGKTESPVDGSLWIGTSGEGVFRLGRNGKRMHYNVASGHLVDDHIAAIGFDNSKVLWILDTTGGVTNYTSVTGFNKVLSIPDGITAASFSGNLSSIFIATPKLTLFSFDVSSESLSDPVVLPAEVLSLFPSVEESFMWATTSNGVLRISPDGSFVNWDDVTLDSNLLPFEFDTNVSQEPLKRGNSNLIWLVFLGVILLIAIVSVLYRFLFFRRKNTNSSEITPNSPVEVITAESTADISSSDTLDTADSSSSRARVPNIIIIESPNLDGVFTKTVLDLIDKNLSDPDFDVDSIASITGLSRIHVNRKLKAEGSPSPSVMLKSARMELASKLLKEGKLTVREVSVSCGFSRPSYFATAFKEYFNISPSDYQGTLEA